MQKIISIKTEEVFYDNELQSHDQDQVTICSIIFIYKYK